MNTEITAEKQRAFTPKAIIAGLIGIILIAAGSKLSFTMANQNLLGGSYLGTGIFFYFFLLCAVWNPVWSKIFPKLVLSAKELAVTLMMSLTAGGFAWIGWLKTIYAQSVMIPEESMTNTRWGTYKVMEFFAKDTFANGGVHDEQIVGGFINGQNMDRTFMPFGDIFSRIPFEGWTNMKYWFTLIILVSLLSLAMLLIVHRQWIYNEKLTYPLASVAESLLKKEKPAQCFADIFHSPLFWIAFCFVFILKGYNFLVALFPNSGFGRIPMAYSLSGLDSTFPIIRNAGCSGVVLNVAIMFGIIGIAYFLAPALSLSIGLNGFVYLIFAAQVYEITGVAPLAYNVQGFRAGAYLGFFIMLIILGRRFYGPLFLKALGIGKAKEEEKFAIFGARLFLITALGSVLIMTKMGVDLPMAIVSTLTLIVVYLIFTRIVCESGIPVMAQPFLPSFVLAKMFGGAAIGPHNLMSGGSLNGVLYGDMSQNLMPYMATGLKVSDDAKVKIGRIVGIIMISIVAALGIAFIFHMWQYYSLGISDPATKTSVWALGVREGFNEVSRLAINGELNEVSDLGFVQRLGRISSAESEIWIYFILGAAAVFLTGFLRTRFLWWPFHAIIFCIWNTTPANTIWASFLFGWFLRTVIVRFGGEANYHRMKPFFFGLIFSEVFVGGCIILYGILSYWITGVPSTVQG